MFVLFKTDTKQQPPHANEKAEIPYHKYEPAGPERKGQHNNIENLSMINSTIICKLRILLDIFNQLILIVLLHTFHELRYINTSHAFNYSNWLENIELGLLRKWDHWEWNEWQKVEQHIPVQVVPEDLLEGTDARLVGGVFRDEVNEEREEEVE